MNDKLQTNSWIRNGERLDDSWLGFLISFEAAKLTSFHV